MAHQDRGLENGPLKFGDQLREVVRWLIEPEAFAGIRFRDDATWTPWRLVGAAMLWAWSAEPTLGERFGSARKIAQEAFGGQGQLATSYQAWMKMLVRWTSNLVGLVLQALRRRMQAQFARAQIAGWNVFAVDGSRVALPRTASNQDAFCPRASRRPDLRKGRGKAGPGQRRSRRKKADNPQLWLTTLWHAGLGLPWNWRTGPSDSSERGHLLAMLPSLPPASLVAGDAGFVGYVYWKALLDAGHSFVIRVGSNVRLLKHLGAARGQEGLVYLWPEAVATHDEPPLVLRLVVVHNGKHPVYLVTNVLRAAELSDDDLVTIYRHRWGIEVYYRSFKQTFGQRKLRSYKAAHARVELDWAMVGLAAACLYAQHCGRIPPRRRSVAQVLKALRHALHHYLLPPGNEPSLHQRLAMATIDAYQRKNKASRDYPRKKQETPPGAPEIIPASPEQIRHARRLRRQHAALGLTA